MYFFLYSFVFYVKNFINFCCCYYEWICLVSVIDLEVRSGLVFYNWKYLVLFCSLLNLYYYVYYLV